jgi:hypothetical protein
MADNEGSQPCPILHQSLKRFFLRDLGDKRNPFCSLTMAETDHGRLVMKRRLRRSSTAVGALSGGVPVPGAALAAEVTVGLLLQAAVRRGKL